MLNSNALRLKIFWNLFCESSDYIFSINCSLTKGKVATLPFTEPIQFILNASKVFGSPKKKQEVDFDLLCRLVPGAGLEPAQPQWPQDFKSCVSTNSTIRANYLLI